MQQPKRRTSRDALKVEQAETRQFEKELRHAGRSRVARNRRRTYEAMNRRAKAKAAFNEAMDVYEKRQSVLIKKGEAI
jgi:hypothetical protein